MPRSDPGQIYKKTKEFKLAAARLSHSPGIRAKAAATALGIHPILLSTRTNDIRDVQLPMHLPNAAPSRYGILPEFRSAARLSKSIRERQSSARILRPLLMLAC